MTDRPNILFLIGEDTGRLLGCYGDPVAQTPNLDRLAARGCRFDCAVSTAPVCAPARSTIISGQYPMKIGTHHMRSRLLQPPRTFTQELRDAGYYVSWPTKLDFNFQPAEGWRDDDRPWLDRLRRGDLPSSPWFFYTNLAITHESNIWPDEPTGPNRPHAEAWGPGKRPRPARRHDPAEVPVPPYLPDTPRVREDIARHYDNIADLDEQVGQILEALDQSGQSDRTIVIFLADHGRGLPREKRWCYSAGLHMPLIVRGPGIEPGSVDERLVSWVDVAPTFLALAGVPIPPSYDGRPFLGANVEPRPYAFGGRDRMDEAFDRVRFCRDDRYHYVRNFFPQLPCAQRIWYMEYMPTMQELRRLRREGQLHGDAATFLRHPRAAEELYDLRTDAHCVRNRIDDPALADVRRRMAQSLEEWMASIRDLGAVPERELIARGLVEDRVAYYRDWMKPLSPEDRIGGISTVIEQHEAEQIAVPPGATAGTPGDVL